MDEHTVERHVLPPERPFRGDDIDTLELIWRVESGRVRRRRRLRRTGILVVVGLCAIAVQPVVEHLLGAWR